MDPRVSGKWEFTWGGYGGEEVGFELCLVSEST